MPRVRLEVIIGVQIPGCVDHSFIPADQHTTKVSKIFLCEGLKIAQRVRIDHVGLRAIHAAGEQGKADGAEAKDLVVCVWDGGAGGIVKAVDEVWTRIIGEAKI